MHGFGLGRGLRISFASEADGRGYWYLNDALAISALLLPRDINTLGDRLFKIRCHDVFGTSAVYVCQRRVL